MEGSGRSEPLSPSPPIRSDDRSLRLEARQANTSPRAAAAAFLLSYSVEGDAGDSGEIDPSLLPQYEELVEMITRAVAKLNLDWLAERFIELQRGILDERFLWVKTSPSPSKQTLNQWIVDAINISYKSSDLPSPMGVKAHSTRNVAASKTFFAGVPLQDLCNAAGWFCRQKCLVDLRGQRRMGRLGRDDRKATVTQITTRYNQGMQNTISERTTRRTLKQMCSSSRRPHRVPLLSVKNRNGGYNSHRITKIEQLKI